MVGLGRDFSDVLIGNPLNGFCGGRGHWTDTSLQEFDNIFCLNNICRVFMNRH